MTTKPLAEFTVRRADFVETVSWAATGTSTRNPVYGVLRFSIDADKMSITGFDSDNTYGAQVDVTFDDSATLPTPDKPVETAIFAPLLMGILKALRKDEILITVGRTQVVFASGRSVFTIPVTKTKDVIAMPDLPPEVGSITASALAAAIKHVADAALVVSDGTPSPLNGILMRLDPTKKTVFFVTTDKYQFATAEERYSPSKASNTTDAAPLDILINARTLKTLVTALDHGDLVRIHADAQSSQVGFSASGRTGALATLSGKYIPFERFLEFTFEHDIVVRKSVLNQALSDLAAASSTGYATSVSFEVQPHDNEVILSLPDGSATIPVEITGYTGEEKIDIYLGSEYLKSAMSALTSTYIAIGFTGPVKPVHVRETDDNNAPIESILRLIMPRKRPVSTS